MLGQEIEDPHNQDADGFKSGHDLDAERNWNGYWYWNHETRTLRLENLISNMEVEAIRATGIPNFTIEVVGECEFRDSEGGKYVISCLEGQFGFFSISGVGSGAKLTISTYKSDSGGILIEHDRDLYVGNCLLKVHSISYYGIAGMGNGSGVGIRLWKGGAIEARGWNGSITGIGDYIQVEENGEWKDINESQTYARTTFYDDEVKYVDGNIVFAESESLVDIAGVMLAPYYPIQVGGLKLHKYRTKLTPDENDEKYSSIIKSGEVEYNAENHTLTLSNATIEPKDYDSGIYSNHPSKYLMIKCEGSNKITTEVGSGIEAKDGGSPFIRGVGTNPSLEIYTPESYLYPGILDASGSSISEANLMVISGISLKISGMLSCIYTDKEGKTLILSKLDAVLSNTSDRSLIEGFETMELWHSYIASPLGAVVEGGTIKLNGEPLTDTTCEIKRGDAPTYNVTIDPNIEHGKVTLSHSGSVAYGTEVTVTVTPNEGYKLSELTANGADITATKKFIVQAATTVSATFVKQTFAVTAKAPQNGKIAIKGYGDLTKVPYGTELTVEVTPNQGYELTKLTANGADITATKKFVVKKATTVEATFVKQTFAVTAKTPQNGKITIKGYSDLKKVPYGTELTVEVTPNQGYTLAKLTANGADITATKKFVVKKATTVEATFAAQTFAVTAKAPQNGKITIKGYSDLKKVPYGTELTVEATPNQGYKLAKLTANGADITATKKFVVKKATTVEATFTKDTAIEEVATTEAILYPNPAEDAATLSGVEPSAMVQVFSIDGVEVLRTEANEAGVARLDLAGVAAGKYLVKSGKTTMVLLVTK